MNFVVFIYVSSVGNLNRNYESLSQINGFLSGACL